MHLDALADQAETEQERTAVQTARTRMEEEWGGAGGRAVGRADPSALQALRAAFEPRGDEAALDRIEALLESNAIYAPYVRTDGSFYESRTRRETLMKKQLAQYITEWEAARGEAPKVFHKNAHTGKRGDHFRTLGGFMSEWALARGEDTFHIMADCNGGQIPKSGQGGGGECTAWLGGEESPLADHFQEGKITIIDLRALRPGYFDWDVLSDDLRRAITSFDAYVAVPDVRPSKPLNPIPRGE